MLNFKDVYKINTRLGLDYMTAEVDVKKEIIERELKTYLVSKVSEANFLPNEIENLDNITIYDLLGILSELYDYIDEESLSQLTHYILIVTSNIQGFEVVWYIEDDERLITEPKIEFDINGCWDKLITHKDTNGMTSFMFVYDVFMNNFLIKDETKKLK